MAGSVTYSSVFKLRTCRGEGGEGARGNQARERERDKQKEKERYIHNLFVFVQLFGFNGSSHLTPKKRIMIKSRINKINKMFSCASCSQVIVISATEHVFCRHYRSP